MTQGKVREQRPPAHPTQSFPTTLFACGEEQVQAGRQIQTTGPTGMRPRRPRPFTDLMLSAVPAQHCLEKKQSRVGSQFQGRQETPVSPLSPSQYIGQDLSYS